MIWGKKLSPKSQMERGMRTVLHILFGEMTLSERAAIIRSFYKECKSPLISSSLFLYYHNPLPFPTL